VWYGYSMEGMLEDECKSIRELPGIWKLFQRHCVWLQFFPPFLHLLSKVKESQL
jgi:hypothetical protein